MKPEGHASSDTGKVRVSNEDSYFADDDLGLYIVADGMGGHAAGEVASRVAVESAVAAVRGGYAALDGSLDVDEAGRVVREAIRTASTAILRRAREDAAKDGMGTTMTMLLILEDKAVMGHVGDSRLYLQRGGQIEQLTKDHTIGASLVEAGLMSAEQARRGPFGNKLARAVGLESDIEVDVAVLRVEQGDRLLLCTDGLSDHLNAPADLAGDLDGTLERIPDSLVEFALASGGHDNITVVVVQLGDAVTSSMVMPWADLDTIR